MEAACNAIIHPTGASHEGKRLLSEALLEFLKVRRWYNMLHDAMTVHPPDALQVQVVCFGLMGKAWTQCTSLHCHAWQHCGIRVLEMLLLVSCFSHGKCVGGERSWPLPTTLAKAMASSDFCRTDSKAIGQYLVLYLEWLMLQQGAGTY